MTALEPLLLLAVAVAAASLVGKRIGVAPPVLLVLGGLAVALLPGDHTIHLEPEVVLTFVIPPLLYAAAIDSSLVDVRAARWGIASLAVGLVLATAGAVALVAHLVVPGLPASAALALGAIVGPPDVVAAVAVGRRLGMPRRLAVLIEGEGMLNDATSLVLYQVAVAAAVTGALSVRDGFVRFLVASLGGVVVGLAVAWLVRLVRSRIDDLLVENTLSVVTPFAAYLAAEHIHASGVLAVVVTGLVLGHMSPTLISGPSRLQTRAVWRLVAFLIEGAVFAVIGLQLPSVVRGLDAYSTGELITYGVAVVAVVVLVRPLWVFPTAYVGERLSARGGRRERLPWQVPAAVSWAGMRGVISLAMATALPATVAGGEPFPHRNLLVFLTFVVICVTLVGQGLTFGPVLRRLSLSSDRHALVLEQADAQQRATAAALARLEELVGEEPPDHDGVVEQLRHFARRRADAAWERLGEHGDGSETPSATYRRLRREMLRGATDAGGASRHRPAVG